ncbi:MAG: hypothetical protein CMJ18_18395 [Phycisphaeraceae bacterium]|nr:hypothetical protein [Phycisphaeraceae bacterium]
MRRTRRDFCACADVLERVVGSEQLGASLLMVSGCPDGEVWLDLRTGACRHSLVGAVELPVGSELRDWFGRRLVKLDCPMTEVSEAMLHLRYRLNRFLTVGGRSALADVSASCRIQIADRQFRGSTTNAIWLTRSIGDRTKPT